MRIEAIAAGASAINALLARAAGNAAAPGPASPAEPAPVIRRDGLQFRFRARDELEQQLRFANSDGDLLDLSFEAQTRLKIDLQGQADLNGPDDAVLRFDLKRKADLRIQAVDSQSGAELTSRARLRQRVQFSIDFDTFEQLAQSSDSLDLASLLQAAATGQPQGDSSAADDDDGPHHHNDGHDHDEDDHHSSEADAAQTGGAPSADGSGAEDSELSDEERRQLEELRARDAEVRAHEAAHLSAAGGLAQGGASFETQVGPDGKAYAVGGEVSVDTSPGATPEETIRKAQQIRRAALAPAEPSAQDRAVAAKAAQMEAKARAELAREQQQSKDAPNATDHDDESDTADRDDAGRVAQRPSSVAGALTHSLISRFDAGLRQQLAGALDLVA